jgi:hypothetical protein
LSIFLFLLFFSETYFSLLSYWLPIYISPFVKILLTFKAEQVLPGLLERYNYLQKLLIPFSDICTFFLGVVLEYHEPAAWPAALQAGHLIPRPCRRLPSHSPHGYSGTYDFRNEPLTVFSLALLFFSSFYTVLVFLVSEKQ